MTDREREIRAFLTAHGFGEARRVALAGDASVRRYERLGGPRPAILMDCPPGTLDVGPFLAVQGRLAELDLSVPEVVAADRERGLVLLEDLGDDTFTSLLGARADEVPFYGAAVDLLAELQGRASHDGLPPYDDAKLMAELELLLAWATPDLPEPAQAAFRKGWREILPGARVGATCLVYVDYHADNLLWLGNRVGHRRVGLLDFQDARAGPPAYDLVSLLEDARRHVPPDLAQRMIERYLALRRDLPRGAFHRSYAILGAQRNSKILGLFRRLALRDGKRQYLDYLPRVDAHLRRDLDHPALRPLRDWYQTHLLAP
jgi:aminoglycoside/choline kinase family phosphotransferase